MRGFLMRIWFLSPEQAEWFSESVRRPVVFGLTGCIVIVISAITLLLVGVHGAFSRKTVKPKEVNRMIAQGKAVFLVDKKVYVTENTHLYNLKDLNRIRKLYKYNLFYVRIYDELKVAKEEKPEVTLTELLEDDGFKNPTIKGENNEKGID